MKINDSLLQLNVFRREKHIEKVQLGKVQLGQKMEKLSCVVQTNLQGNDLKFDP